MMLPLDGAQLWAAIPGYEGHYEVSDGGLVRSIRRIIHTTNGQARWIRERILRPCVNTTYPQVSLSLERKGKTFNVHALVALAFLGPRPEGMEVCHGDGDYSNYCLANLRYDTRAANVRDSVTHGTNFWAKRTHCVNDHQFTPANTRYRKGTARVCITCANDRARRQQERRRLAA